MSHAGLAMLANVVRKDGESTATDTKSLSLDGRMSRGFKHEIRLSACEADGAWEPSNTPSSSPRTASSSMAEAVFRRLFETFAEGAAADDMDLGSAVRVCPSPNGNVLCSNLQLINSFTSNTINIFI
jgi:hypothetical protein